MFQTNIEGQAGLTYPIFPYRIVNVRETGKIEYYLQDPLVAYHQNSSNRCCLSSLAPAFTTSGGKILPGIL